MIHRRVGGEVFLGGPAEHNQANNNEPLGLPLSTFCLHHVAYRTTVNLCCDV